MALIVSHQIRTREFGKSIPEADRKVLERSARIALATPIAGEGLPRGTRLLKAYATSPDGPRRIVYLLSVADADLFLLFFRDKKDSVGANITMKNKAFKAQLHKHLGMLGEDIENGAYDVMELS